MGKKLSCTTFFGGFYIPLFSLAFFPIPWIGAGFPWPTDDFRQAALRALGFEVKKEDAAAPKWLRSSPVVAWWVRGWKNSPIFQGLVSSLEHFLFSRIYGIVLLANILAIILANINDGLVKPSVFSLQKFVWQKLGMKRKASCWQIRKFAQNVGIQLETITNWGVHPWKWWFFAF